MTQNFSLAQLAGTSGPPDSYRYRKGETLVFTVTGQTISKSNRYYGCFVLYVIPPKEM
jgi:hypothetical protein